MKAGVLDDDGIDVSRKMREEVLRFPGIAGALSYHLRRWPAREFGENHLSVLVGDRVIRVDSGYKPVDTFFPGSASFQISRKSRLRSRSVPGIWLRLLQRLPWRSA